MNLKQLNDGTLIELEVVPNSSDFRILFNSFTQKFKIKLKSKALDGKANRELLAILKELFLAEVIIIKGLKSRDKVLLIKGKKLEQVSKILSDALAQ